MRRPSGPRARPAGPRPRPPCAAPRGSSRRPALVPVARAGRRDPERRPPGPWLLRQTPGGWPGRGRPRRGGPLRRRMRPRSRRAGCRPLPRGAPAPVREIGWESSASPVDAPGSKRPEISGFARRKVAERTSPPTATRRASASTTRGWRARASVTASSGESGVAPADRIRRGRNGNSRSRGLRRGNPMGWTPGRWAVDRGSASDEAAPARPGVARRSQAMGGRCGGPVERSAGRQPVGTAPRLGVGASDSAGRITQAASGATRRASASAPAATAALWHSPWSATWDGHCSSWACRARSPGRS